MSIAVVSMASPFRWLSKSLDIGRRHPGALFGGFALLLLVALLPTVLQLGLQFTLKPSPAMMLTVSVAAMLLSLLILPPLVGGAFRLVHACETGATPRAWDILALYRDPPTALRMVLTALLVVGLYLLVLAAMALLPGATYFGQVMMVAMTTAPGAQPDLAGVVPPEGLLAWLPVWLLALMFAAIVLTNAYMLAFAQAALGGRSPLLAVAEGLWASLKNLLPLTGIFLVLVFGGFVVVLLFAVLAGIVFAVLSLISPVLAMAVAAPVYLGLMLLMYVLMFGFYYQAWREIFGGLAASSEVVA